MSLTKGGVVGYQNVTVSQSGNGKTKYAFTSPKEIFNTASNVYILIDNSVSNNCFPYTQEFDNDWKRGLIEEVKTTLDDENSVISQVNYTYNKSPADYTESYSYGLLPGINYVDGFARFRGGLYRYQSGSYYKDTEVKKVYEIKDQIVSDESITTQITYEYKTITVASKQYSFLRSITSLESTDKELRLEFKYPIDYFRGTIVAPTTEPAKSIYKLKRDRIWNVPIETYTQKGNSVIDGKITLFKDYNSSPLSAQILPFQEYQLDISEPILFENFTPSYREEVDGIDFTMDFHKDSRYERKGTYDKYDDFGNILQYHNTNDINRTFIWGYNNTYPIAKIINTNKNEVYYNSFEEDEFAIERDWSKTGDFVKEITSEYSIITSFTENLPEGKYRLTYWWKSGVDASWEPIVEEETFVTGGQITTEKTSGYIDELRLHPVDAKMTTYTYNPLVGVTSVTDDNNLTMYYEYDDFGRLEYIKNDDGEILEKHEYNNEYEYNYESDIITNAYSDPSFIYEGESTTLSVIGVSGPNSQYEWYFNNCDGDTFVGTGSTIEVTPDLTPGTYYYYVRLVNTEDGSETDCVSAALFVLDQQLSVTPDNYTFNSAGNQPAIFIVDYGNYSWTVQSEEQWLSIEKINEESFSVTCTTENTSNESRPGSITVEGGGLTKIISVWQAPMAQLIVNFSYSNSINLEKFNFIDLSTSDSSDPIISWKWDFNDDGIIDSTAKDPEDIDITSDTTVKLIVKTQSNKEASVSKTVKIQE